MRPLLAFIERRRSVYFIFIFIFLLSTNQPYQGQGPDYAGNLLWGSLTEAWMLIWSDAPIKLMNKSTPPLPNKFGENIRVESRRGNTNFLPACRIFYRGLNKLRIDGNLGVHFLLHWVEATFLLARGVRPLSTSYLPLIPSCYRSWHKTWSGVVFLGRLVNCLPESALKDTIRVRNILNDALGVVYSPVLQAANYSDCYYIG